MEKNAGFLARRKAVGGITLTALFAALTAAGTFIAIPLPFSPVPVALQNLFAILAGLCLGPFLGSLSVALYLAAGALGAPVFAGASGGIARLLGPTGGYLLGYLIGALVAGLVAGRPRTGAQDRLWRLILGAALGLLAVYVPGTLRLKQLMGFGWPQALVGGILPFLPGDAAKAAVAALIAPRLRRVIAELR
ncbi:MAG: biotin transporter BioY [Treponema sp.]|jgi:biotin transport system substrate-specific component|nr:biotin transporter BioY [Treponema sp.]